MKIFKFNLGVLTALLILAMAASALAADDYFNYSDTAISGYGCGAYKLNDTSGHLYVNQSGNCVVLLVSIPAGSSPHMHPDNPEDSGAIALRTFSHVQTYNFSADAGWVSGASHHASFYISATHIYFGPDNYGAGGIEKWDKNPDGTFGAYVGQLAIPVPSFNNPITNGETFGYDEANDVFYTCTREREVYSFEVGVDAKWQYEFTHPNYSGGHHDGLEFAGGALWISDMTSDTLAQFRYTGSGAYNGWEESKRLGYTNPEAIEGMDYGPCDHFWATSGSKVIEIGGGKAMVDAIPTLTEWGMIIFCVLLFGWMAWVIVRRRRRAAASVS